MIIPNYLISHLSGSILYLISDFIQSKRPNVRLLPFLASSPSDWCVTLMYLWKSTIKKVCVWANKSGIQGHYLQFSYSANEILFPEMNLFHFLIFIEYLENGFLANSLHSIYQWLCPINIVSHTWRSFFLSQKSTTTSKWQVILICHINCPIAWITKIDTI